MDPNNINHSSAQKLWVILPISILLMIFWQWISSPMIITVTGTGEVVVPATNAKVTFGIVSTDPSAKGAIAQVTTKANTIKSLLTSKGVIDENILTSQVTASPIPSGGFQASIAMSAKTARVTEVGELVSTLYANGATVVSQPVLSVENEDALDAKAYNSALEKAGDKALRIGLKNWKFIRKVVSVSSQSSGTTSTSTSTGSTDEAQNGVFKIIEAVSVNYKMW